MAFEFIKNMFNPRNIAIIDDDEDTRNAYRRVLEKKKYKVISCASFTEIGSLEDLNDVDLFFIDLFLKEGPSGVEIAKILRQEGFECPICFVSGKKCNLDEEHHLTSFATGLHFMQKPINPDALLRLAAELTATI